MESLPQQKKRLVVIGLDCAEPTLVFDRLKTTLPHLSGLMEKGEYGTLQSTQPPITIPAWLSMFSGRDPGQLGVYGFRNRSGWDYGELQTFSSRDCQVPMLWDRLSEEGLVSYLLGVPGTYPPRPIRGRMVSGFLAPNNQSHYVWPGSYKQKLEELAQTYRLDATEFRTQNKSQLLAQLHEMTQKRFRVARAWAQEPNWDLMIMVEMGPDRIHHGFWRTFDPTHRAYQPGHEFSQAIPDYYTFLDQQIGRLLALLDDRTAVLVVSDHGAQAMQGAFRINQWLLQQGDLVLKTTPQTPVPLEAGRVDWSKTKAWAAGGYFARIFINAKDREPQGQVRVDQLDDYLKSMESRLASIVDPAGNALNTRVFRPARLYRQQLGYPPDLMVYIGDLAWRAVAQVGCDSLYAFENDTGPDDANHAEQGLFIHWDPRLPAAGKKSRSIYEIAPLILKYFGM
jgi:predicted AlkP superfamily phosphohydrolase/phosphomutase